MSLLTTSVTCLLINDGRKELFILSISTKLFRAHNNIWMLQKHKVLNELRKLYNNHEATPPPCGNFDYYSTSHNKKNIYVANFCVRKEKKAVNEISWELRKYIQCEVWCASSALNVVIFPVVAHVLQNTQRISSSTQPLATPVVSVTTPSLPPQGLVYSGMPTSYNPAGESGPDIKCLSCDCLHSVLFSSLLFFWVILML